MSYANLFNTHENDYMMLVYALLWTFTFIYSYKKNGLQVGVFMTLLYTITSYIAIYFFYEVNESGIISWSVDSQKFHIGAFLYLYVAIMLFLLPILKHSKFLSIVSINYNYTSSLKSGLLLISPVVLWGVASIAYAALNVDSMSLADTYESSISGENTLAHINFLGKKCIVFITYFSLLWPILFFMCLSGNSTFKKLAIIPGLAFLCTILTAYVCAARVGIVKNLMYMGIVYFLHRNNLESDIRKKLKLYFGGGLAFIVLILTIITIARFGDNSADANVFLTMYLGEGELRFAENVWNTTKFMNGDMCFSTFKNWFGFDTFFDLMERREFYNSKLGFSTSIFMTFIGDLVLDLGRIGGFASFATFSLIINAYLNRCSSKQTMEIDDIYWLSLILLTIAFGFTYLFWKLPSIHLEIIRCTITVYVIKYLTKEQTN